MEHYIRELKPLYNLKLNQIILRRNYSKNSFLATILLINLINNKKKCQIRSVLMISFLIKMRFKIKKLRNWYFHHKKYVSYPLLLNPFFYLCIKWLLLHLFYNSNKAIMELFNLFFKIKKLIKILLTNSLQILMKVKMWPKTIFASVMKSNKITRNSRCPFNI